MYGCANELATRVVFDLMSVQKGQGASGSGPLTEWVLAYDKRIRELVQTVKIPADWEPLGEYIAINDFERVGTLLEVHNWEQYTHMLSQWALSTQSFESNVRRISEVGNLVYYEIEERHHRGDTLIVLNTLTVFEFDEQGKIRRLNVYLQRAGN
jgi:hypothetical protein